MSAPDPTRDAGRDPGSAELVRLVAGREISARLRDKNFIIGVVLTVVLLIGILGFQVAVNSGGEEPRLGVVGDTAQLGPAVEAQGQAIGIDVTVVPLDDEAAARQAVETGDVDGALLAGGGPAPELLVEDRDATMEAVVNAAVSGVAVAQQLAEAGVDLDAVPEVEVTALAADDEEDQQQVLVAIIGVGLLYGLLIMFGQFVAQGVVEEKASRVVELLLATMRPWQLLAGKIIGLGVLGLAQIVLIGVIAVGGALAFDVVAVPGALIGTVVSVVLWFVLGYAFYAAAFAVAASLVSRQEDLGSVLTPMMVLLIGGFFVGIQAAADPGGTLAVVTSYVPGLSPLVMPVRQAAGEAAAWEVAVAVAVMLVAIVAAVRLGGRVYAGALLRTSGKTKLREALRAERA
ncbi:ABC transporter permease [Blastococcus sp. MG754426]|uniref:ABC transporter permease n=1 Tax=unclassified Blastococcus TaxID=2619396 RepID=UPI001EF0F2EA|nr:MULTISPECIES: ABC transporter permease [unclassified Blastococcus]MCF6506128.1 ABC transporter permease [Blastococcus sp. MG754426]MCF6510494.1 ABC transporter permease [Blastococcus sp. MG754427]MCF6734658.1 ABC transporter permease [Blastococcus sp. KM273129]